MRAPLFAALLACAAGTASAQSAPGEAKTFAPSTAAPDVVRLRNGGLLRGTISELVPGESVVLITATGEVRRFAMADVEYAGPAAGLPGAAAPPAASAPPPPARAADGRLSIRLRSSLPEVTFHQRIASEVSTGGAISFGIGLGGGGGRGGVGFTPYASTGATYAPLCQAPCELAMMPGTYYFGLSLEDRLPVSQDKPVVVPPGATQIMGEYVDHQELRVAGYVVGAASFVGGAALFGWAAITGAQICSDRGGCVVPEERTTALGAGLGIMLGGAVISYVLGSFDDEVEVTVQ